MLFQSDLRLLLTYYSLISKFGVIPVNVTLQPVRFRAKPSIKGLGIVRCLLFCRLILLWHSLVYTILYPSKKFYHLLASLCFATGLTVALAMDSFLLTNRNYVSSVFNGFYLHILTGNRPWKYVRKVSGAEFLVIFTPVIVFNFSIPTLVLIFWFDPALPTLLWAVVPDHYRNIYTLGACIFTDFVGVTILMTLVTFIVVFAIGFVATMDKRMTTIDREISRVHKTRLSPLTAIRVMDTVSAELREIQTWLKLFNEVTAHVVYLAKQISLAISILCLFICIFYVKRDPAISFIGFLFGVPLLIFYNVALGKAFGLPNKMERIKDNIRIAAYSLKLRYRTRYYLKLASSFQFKGIQVGSFGVLERESTPSFMNFVVQEVGSLLVGTDQFSKLAEGGKM